MSDLLDVKAVVDNVCRMAVAVPVEDAVALVNEFKRMETLMPLVDPTGFIAVSKTMPGHEEVARAFLDFRLRLEKLKEASNE